VLHSQDTSIKP